MRIANGSTVGAAGLEEIETRLSKNDPSYSPGHFLSLVRLAQDLADTTLHGMTAVEGRSLHLLERRLVEMQNTERPARPEWIADCLSLLRSSDHLRRTALLDLMRYLEEVTGHPLVGFPEQVASDSIHLLLALQFATSRFLEISPTLVPLDVCLGARCSLANSRVLHLKLGSLLDHVLSPELPMWSNLADWTSQIDHRLPAVFCLSPELLESAFVIEGIGLQPLDLVLSVAEKLDRTAKRHSVSESLVALERTLYRRIYRQESSKHHMTVLLRRVMDRAMHEKHRRSMRLTSPIPHLPQITLRENQLESDAENPAWKALRDQADSLEAARDRGYTPCIHAAWTRIFGAPSEVSDHPEDLDEFLRWIFDLRSGLEAGLELLTSRELSQLAIWYRALAFRADEIKVRRPGKSSVRRNQIQRATPLLWLAAARRLLAHPSSAAQLVTGPLDEAFLARADGHIPAALEHWRGLHPWECGLFGIWPPELRGARFMEGIKTGVRRAQLEGARKSEIQVRLDLLTHELEYRSWLGARERVALLERTLEPA